MLLSARLRSLINVRVSRGTIAREEYPTRTTGLPANLKSTERRRRCGCTQAASCFSDRYIQPQSFPSRVQIVQDKIVSQMMREQKKKKAASAFLPSSPLGFGSQRSLGASQRSLGATQGPTKPASGGGRREAGGGMRDAGRGPRRRRQL